jgi:hypothetical protein
MPAQDNLSTLTFTPAELTLLDGYVTGIQGLFASKGVEVLTPDEMKDYSKVANERYGFVKMVADDVKKNPSLLSPRVKQADWDVDTATEGVLSSRISQIENLSKISFSAYALVLFDMWVAANICYRYVRLLAREGDPLANTFYNKWSAQYESTTPVKKP